MKNKLVLYVNKTKELIVDLKKKETRGTNWQAAGVRITSRSVSSVSQDSSVLSTFVLPSLWIHPRYSTVS